MIEVYKFCPNCGKPLNPEKNSKFFDCSFCGFHYYITSYPTCGAILENENGEILMVERKNEPKAGFWDIPGGFVDLNENLEAALVRELKEEIGIIADRLIYIGSSTDLYPYKDVIYITICALYSGKISGKIYPADDVASYKFFNKKNFPKEYLIRPYLSSLKILYWILFSTVFQ